MPLKRIILELGTGNDLYGEDYTKAAVRAVQDAMHEIPDEHVFHIKLYTDVIDVLKIDFKAGGVVERNLTVKYLQHQAGYFFGCEFLVGHVSGISSLESTLMNQT